MIRVLRRLTIVAVFACGLNISCDSPLAPLPKGAPEAFEFWLAVMDAPTSATWTVQRDTLVFRHCPGTYHGEPCQTSSSVPTAEQWREFWSAADEAGLRRWRSRYEPLIADGMGWSLSLRNGSLAVESSGQNEYPDHAGRGHLDSTPAFRSFVEALNALSGSNYPAP